MQAADRATVKADCDALTSVPIAADSPLDLFPEDASVRRFHDVLFPFHTLLLFKPSELGSHLSCATQQSKPSSSNAQQSALHAQSACWPAQQSAQLGANRSRVVSVWTVYSVSFILCPLCAVPC